MNFIENLMNKIMVFEKAPQKIGLSQFKEENIEKPKPQVSIKSKDVKLSDLMRRAS